MLDLYSDPTRSLNIQGQQILIGQQLFASVSTRWFPKGIDYHYQLDSCVVRESISQNGIGNERQLEILTATCQPEFGLFFNDDDQDTFRGAAMNGVNEDTADFSFLGFNFEGIQEELIIECTLNICLNSVYDQCIRRC